ncbi:MAG: hypothetical protein HQK54_10805 [Oligoflexales bacterium]|nr:hypothetical protein [Oligoflexales bacterium]
MNATTEGENSLGLGSSQNPEGTRIDTKAGAQRAMTVIDDALGRVASYRATLGAYQNRLEPTDRNLSVNIENIGAANSRIRDADFAEETSEFTQAQILTQAGTSVLTQANQMPNIVLKLLQG